MRLLSVTRTINAPLGDVWALTSSFGAVGLWAAGIARVSLKGAGIGAVRRCTTANGEAIEQLTLLDEDHYRVRYTVSTPGTGRIRGFVGGTDLTEVDAAQTRIEWVVDADSVEGDVSALSNGLRKFIEASLTGLAQTLKVSIEP